MAIRTPRPRPVSEPTLLGGLLQTFDEVKERQRVQRLEDRARQRSEQREDLLFEGEQQRQGVERGTFLRQVRGLEEIGGGGPTPGSVTDFSAALQPRQSLGQFAQGAPLAPAPQAPLLADMSAADLRAFQPGQGQSIEPRAVGGERRRQQSGRESALLTPGRPSRPQFQETGLRRLEPARDPTIVNPQLLPRAQAPDLGFAPIERRLNLPGSSLEQAFRDDPVGTLNFLKEDIIRGGSGGSDRELTSIRLAVGQRIDAIGQQLEFILDASSSPQADAEMKVLRDEMDELTVGLIQAVIGSEDFSAEEAADEIDRMFPDLEDEEKAERLQNVVRAAGRAARFAGRARGALESGR